MTSQTDRNRELQWEAVTARAELQVRIAERDRARAEVDRLRGIVNAQKADGGWHAERRRLRASERLARLERRQIARDRDRLRGRAQGAEAKLADVASRIGRWASRAECGCESCTIIRTVLADVGVALQDPAQPADGEPAVQTCTGCGCTDDSACHWPGIGQCSWISADRCSACGPDDVVVGARVHTALISAGQAEIPHPRLFALERTHDVSGVSGTGTVAYGVQFPDGRVATRWNAGPDGVAQTCAWDSIHDVEAIHGHGGATQVRWLDEIEA